ncbi:hypothetical protein PDIG_85990 [Penicillium digitatum PHI26]|uniref:Uncharacterized protein n=2 Tax=Penicillium digitatum TaxID=36651 RepID=K9F6I7_PEND2|nr:hypothetical protein PDIP_47080 [Penicillium digitatum Pd1]EKV04935.1 hypothetical protein PDIG_85990 [Penicillium digitatum PHI26]EKV13755.1 hypothetical protein PDIP_47080 [Penicillium digitatum Pd1]
MTIFNKGALAQLPAPHSLRRLPAVGLPFCLSASPTLFKKPLKRWEHATGQGSIQAMVQSVCVMNQRR